jgi:hypothetical protein
MHGKLEVNGTKNPVIKICDVYAICLRGLLKESDIRLLDNYRAPAA